MPGPVSDSFDPEWTTGYNASLITDALDHVYAHLTGILDGKPPLYILDLVDPGTQESMTEQKTATLTEWEWRLLRFAVERAKDSI